jgi:hypothetical protein
MHKLSDKQWQSLASALQGAVVRLAPDWTAHNTHDPGVTVLELLTYALKDLQHRKPLKASGRALARRVAQLAESLAATPGADECPPGMQRPNFFVGGLLSAEDLMAEQDYHRAKAQRRNRLLHGTGVVAGLGVTLERTGSSARAVIAPGLALNAQGEEIEVSAATALPLPAAGSALLVLLHYAEQPCRPVPALTSTGETDAPAVFSRIAETFTAALAPAADDNAVALARVNFSRGRWALDRKFKVAKVRA